LCRASSFRLSVLQRMCRHSRGSQARLIRTSWIKPLGAAGLAHVSGAAGISRRRTQLLFDAQQLIIFLYPFAACRRPSLEVAGIERHS
jgi:hypothetical protein